MVQKYRSLENSTKGNLGYELDLLASDEVLSKEGNLLDLGVAQSLIEKSGSWFSYKGDRIGQGRENARQFLKDNPDIRDGIDTELRKALGLIRTEPQNGTPMEPPPSVARPTAVPRPRQ